MKEIYCIIQNAALIVDIIYMNILFDIIEYGYQLCFRITTFIINKIQWYKTIRENPKNFVENKAFFAPPLHKIL